MLTITKGDLTVDTIKFVASHGRQPPARGTNWAFVPADKWDAPRYIDFVVWSPSGLTLDAAIAWLASEGGATGSWLLCP